MKRQGLFFFATLFGGAKPGSEKKIKSAQPQREFPREVIITAASQPNVLQRRMQEKKLTHGETIMASMSPVRLEVGDEKMALFFCPMNSLEIIETIAPGDGTELPGTVVVSGLQVPADFKPGMYSLKNVKLSSNGTMQVIATEKTTWEKFVEQPVDM
ncbi:MAG TPA: hypothetical protein VFU05_14830 [Cyclobacteriaceae bacterium]|nr:hypothetical protein [Cyclobacteriaceae bacterium]